MKLQLPFTLVLMLLSYTVAFASDLTGCHGQTFQVNLIARPIVTGQDPEHDEDLNNKHRVPTRPISCTIDGNGVTFQMDNEPEIISYDIFDAEGMSIASFGDEESFIETLFSLSGEYMVVFTTSECCYTGFVNI